MRPSSTTSRITAKPSYLVSCSQIYLAGIGKKHFTFFGWIYGGSVSLMWVEFCLALRLDVCLAFSSQSPRFPFQKKLKANASRMISHLVNIGIFHCRDTTKQHRGVHQVSPSCKEGLVTWRNPYGAIRLTLGGLKTRAKNSKGVELCFLAKSNLTTTKISLEKDHIVSNSASAHKSASHGNVDGSVSSEHQSQFGQRASPLTALVTLDLDNPQTEREVCVRSRRGAVTLYVEADHDASAYTIGIVEIQYSVDALQKTSALSRDPLEGELTFWIETVCT